MLRINSVTDKAFQKYGRVLSLDTAELIAVAETVPMPASGSSYVPSCEAFNGLVFQKIMQETVFGQLPAQTGYCWGHNDTLNALEWHTCSEVNVAVHDLILLLGDVRDISDERYDTGKIEAFRLNRGEAIEVYATTLHFCPIEVDPAVGFGCIVGLTEGTNTKLENAKQGLLWAKNKWLLAHEENTGLIARGAHPGLYGKNYKAGEDF